MRVINKDTIREDRGAPADSKVQRRDLVVQEVEICLRSTRTGNGYFCTRCQTHHLERWDSKCNHNVQHVCLERVCGRIMTEEWQDGR